MGEKQLVVNLRGRWPDWAKVVLGFLALLAPELLGGSWPVLGLDDTGGLLMVAAGVWASYRPEERAPQWLAMAAALLLVLWPSFVEPVARAAPWVGIIAGGCGALSAVLRLHEISGRGREP